MTKTKYKSICFIAPARIRPGKRVTDIDALGNITLTRVTDGDRDDLVVGGTGIAAEVPWHNVASAIRLDDDAKPEKAK